MNNPLSLTPILVGGLYLAATMSLHGQSEKNKPILIRKVAIVDVINGKLINGNSLLIQDSRIQSIGEESGTEIPQDCQIIEGAGKYLIPGLWDMHIHWYDRKTMALFPINGVTGVRLMWGSPFHTQWKAGFDSGKNLGPRIYMAGPLVDGPNPIWPNSMVARDEATAKKAVQISRRMKADFVKVYSLLPRESYFAIARECEKNELPFAGHVPIMITAREASLAGQRSMEHMYEILLACSRREHELRQVLSDHVISNEGKIRSGMQIKRKIAQQALASYDKQKAEALFRMFAKNQTYQCPTLTVLNNLAYLSTDAVQKNPYLKYLPAHIRQSIAPEKRGRPGTKAQVQAQRKQFEFLRRLLPDMERQGVPIIAGTDVLNPFCLPGFSLHQELELMVQSGLSPKVALQSATINAAQFMGREKQLGSIEVGKTADLVLLNGNPLEKINNTRRIEAVIYRGKALQRNQLDQLLGDFETSAKKGRD